MAGEETAVLRGGSRDGETATVPDHVMRLYASAEAPGMLEIYERTGERQSVSGNDDPAEVFAHAGRAPATEVAPQTQHMPDHRP